MATGLKAWQARCERMERVVLAQHALELRSQRQKASPAREKPSAARPQTPRARAV